MSAEIQLDTVEGEGSIAVPSKYLLETLKLMSEMPINFATEEDGESISLKFSVTDGEYNGHCFKGDEYPTTPVMSENATGFDIDANILYRAISKTLFATGTDDLRPTMMGVLCELNEDNITFVATDAHKLVKYRNNAVKTINPTSFILPKKPLQQLKGVIGSESGAIHVDYSAENNHIRFSFGNIVLYSSLLEGNYPKYKSVIPTNNTKGIWEFRAEYGSNEYRLLSFWDKTTASVVIATHGFDKKSKKTPKNEIDHAEKIRDKYYEQK